MTVTVEKYVWGDGEVALKLIDYGYKFLDISTERGDLQIFIESLISISKDMLKISGSGELAIAIIKKGSDIYLAIGDTCLLLLEMERIKEMENRRGR